MIVSVIEEQPKNRPALYAFIDDLARTKSELENAYATFENMVEPDLIDASIYEVKAVQMRYQFLLARVKQIEDSYTKNPLDASD